MDDIRARVRLGRVGKMMTWIAVVENVRFGWPRMSGTEWDQVGHLLRARWMAAAAGSTR